MTRRILPCLILSVALASACAKKAPVVGAPAPAPPFPSAAGSASAGSGGENPGGPVAPPALPPDAGFRTSVIPTADNRPIDEINGPNSPFKAVLFAYDSDELDEVAKKALTENAEVLKANRSWVVTIEGHCDERGSAEYNLALGDRRALAARNFLVSLGIAADRLRTVSYGKEFPYDPGHTEAAWTRNRRAHMMLTAK
jgi:peptidoglycan-associated lipoprotein